MIATRNLAIDGKTDSPQLCTMLHTLHAILGLLAASADPFAPLPPNRPSMSDSARAEDSDLTDARRFIADVMPLKRRTGLRQPDFLRDRSPSWVDTTNRFGRLHAAPLLRRRAWSQRLYLWRRTASKSEIPTCIVPVPLSLPKTPSSLISKDLRASPVWACYAIMPPHRTRTEV